MCIFLSLKQTRITMDFSPCLDIFFEDLPFAKRIENIANLGYKNFEFWTWWDKNMDEVAEASERYGVHPVAYCTKFISLVDISKRAEYIDGLAGTIENVKKTGTKIIISQVGDELPDTLRETQVESLIDGLKESAKLLEGTDIILAIEPLNTYYDHQRYFLYSSEEAVEIIKAVDSPNVKMLFDIYHQQIMEGNLVNNIKKHIDNIAHFHIADVPGRHEIGSGEINYPNVFKAIRETEYKGCVGVEFFPLNTNHREVLDNPLFLDS